MRSFIWALCLSVCAVLTFVGSFNYYIDPLAYYRTDKIQSGKKSVSGFYQLGQITLKHPDGQVVIIGSSRAQTTPPIWIQNKLKRKVINLGMGQSDLYSKLLALSMAIQNTKVKEVIWYADYFELIPEMRDKKVFSTPAFQEYLSKVTSLTLKDRIENGFLRWREIFDHNMLEAAFYSLKVEPPDATNQGSGSYLDIANCLDPNGKSERSAVSLGRELNSTFEHYTRRILKFPMSEVLWDQFSRSLEALVKVNGIKFYILLPPYHPEFLRRLEAEFPDQYSEHQRWRKLFAALQSQNIKVFDAFDGIPGADASERYWNDGTHFNCRGAVNLLQPVLAKMVE